MFDIKIWKVFLDFVILLVVACPPLVFLLGAVDPYQRGFFVNDESIRLPYKEQLISEGMLAGVGFGLIVCTVVLVELVRDKRGSGVGDKSLSSSQIAGWVWQSYVTIGVFTFGAACQQLLTVLPKYTIGRLRPHFYEVCDPIFNITSPLNQLGYIQDYSCRGEDLSKLKEMRLSFPSAHASFSMYTAVFFVLYIQMKGKWQGSKLLRHMFQYAVFLGAWYVSLSRVTDHMHHWSDVTVGVIVGATVAILTFNYVLKPKKFSNSIWQEPAPENILPRPVLAPQITLR